MPYAKLVLAGAVVVLACFALVLLKSRRGAGPMLTQPSGLPPLKGSLDADKRGRGVDVRLGREILEMLETGRRAEEAEAALAKLDNLRKRLES
jgi:hypothetical protein